MPPHLETLRLAATILALLLSAHVVGALFAGLRQPRVIGEIVGGLLLGPTLLGVFAPTAGDWLFPKTGLVAVALPILSQVGLLLLMYASGSQLRTFVAAGEKRVVAWLSLAGTLLPLVAGVSYVGLVDTSALTGVAQNSTAFVLVFATAIAIASIPVISRIMLDLGIMQTSFARIVIATAVIDDLLLYLLLAVALSLVSAGGSPHGLVALLPLEAGGHLAAIVHVLSAVAVVAVVLTAGPRYWRLLASQTAGTKRPLRDALAHLVFLALVAAICLLLDVNLMFGSLAAGMVAGRALRDRRAALPRSFEWASLKVFVPLYFALVGVRLDLIHHFDAVYFALFLGFACAVKAVSIYVGARAAGESNASAFNLAAALNARGGPGIVLAAVSYDAGIINENFFAILVLTAIVTSMAAGSWLGRLVRQGHSLRAEPNPWPELNRSTQRASPAS